MADKPLKTEAQTTEAEAEADTTGQISYAGAFQLKAEANIREEAAAKKIRLTIERGELLQKLTQAPLTQRPAIMRELAQNEQAIATCDKDISSPEIDLGLD